MARKIGSRYTAHQVLGRGSAGTVWLGEGPEGPVAIKLLREDLASDQDLVGRFVQERTALLSLDHPHIVGIRDLVVDGTDLALVMDLVRGTDLRSRLERERRLAPEAAVSIAADVADGLAAAHAAGVVHRDVKPENVLLDSAAPPGPGGAPPALLTDFGIARLVDSPRRTRATRIIGTPDYLAPEIIEGLPPRASVDIYALATVLYELLAGFTPFGGGHPGAVLRRHVTETVAPLPDLPDDLWQLLSQCLAKGPASRLKATELAERLRAQLPQLAGMPPIDVDVPDADDLPEADAEPYDYNTGGAESYEPVGRRGAVPLVRGAAPDSTRDTHTSMKLPTAEELSSPRPAGGGGRGPKHRAVPDTVRRRRVKLGAAAAAALVATGLGAWAVTSGSDNGGATQQDPQPDNSTASTASSPTPTAPTAGAASPQGAVESPVPLPHWSAFKTAPAAAVGLTGGPRAITVSGTTYVFARGADKNIWYITHTRTAGYGNWQRLIGISTADDPAVVSSRAGRLDIFALGTDHLLYRRTMTAGQWGSWYQVDERTHFSSAPAAASSEPGRIDLVGRTSSDLVTASLVDGRWNAWALVPTAGRITSAPGLLSRSHGSLDAFVVRKADGAVLRLPYVNGAWRPAQLVNGLDATGRPEPVLVGHQLYAFTPAADGGLAQAVAPATGAATWSVATVAPVASSAAAATAASSGGTVELYIRTASGRLARSTASPA
ncbi:serine/threonine protein kinase [Actinacidiphila oryziradicis]|uniref:non-specific serine/threonine protein kinase n=1 Tax=Actinacidiphila oryziradicis TaxID=2571141 RepID=A0A4U0SXL4_9ACTN|nr:serine/threonine protein kinase [Actinacidiphila oryziradicis]